MKALYLNFMRTISKVILNKLGYELITEIEELHDGPHSEAIKFTKRKEESVCQQVKYKKNDKIHESIKFFIREIANLVTAENPFVIPFLITNIDFLLMFILMIFQFSIFFILNILITKWFERLPFWSFYFHKNQFLLFLWGKWRFIIHFQWPVRPIYPNLIRLNHYL